MQELTILIPDEFTEDQIAFIKQSALNQIEAEMRKDLVVPPETVAAVEAKVTALKEAVFAAEIAALKPK